MKEARYRRVAVALKHVALVIICIHMAFVECDVIYILPSLSTAGCPLKSGYNCFLLSQISDHLLYMSHGSNTTLLFHPGKHTLTSNLTIKHYSYFTMKSSTGTSSLQRPVISCQQFSNFQFISITSVSINGLMFVKCLNNTVLNVDHFTLKDSILVGKSLLPGKAMTVSQSNLHIIRSSFDFFNSTIYQSGGTIELINNSSSNISYSNFTNNNARSGSAILGYGTTMTIFGSNFCHNKAEKYRPFSMRGGTILCVECNITVNETLFEYNQARFGGAILVFYGFITINSVSFGHNTAEFGGALYAIDTKLCIHGNTTFNGNVAYYGAAAIIFTSIATINSNLSIINNSAIIGGIGIIHSTITLGKYIVFSKNVGSIFVYSGYVTITGEAIFSKNNQPTITKEDYSTNTPSVAIYYDFSFQGGGLTLFGSRLKLQGSITLTNNTTSTGGGILAITSTIDCSCDLHLFANTASGTGGGFYLYQSELSIRDNSHVEIIGNRALKHGGGIHAISAFIKLVNAQNMSGKGNLLKLSSNVAEFYGGGIFFEAGSKMYFLEYMENHVRFINNTADYGGAIYIADDTNVGACDDVQTLTTATQSECFFQPLTIRLNLHGHQLGTPTINEVITFLQNHAKYSGKDLYGGLLDRCIINAFGKGFKYSSLQGFAKNILNSTTSKSVRICLCNIQEKVECGSTISLNVTKNERFVLNVAAVDHLNHTMNATVFSYVTDNQASLGEEQKIQRVESGCSEIAFSVVSPKETTTLVAYAEGPCKDLGISPLRVVIKFIPCRCPLGFEQNKVIKNKCICICHHKLKQALKSITDSNCNSTTHLLTRNRDFWISYVSNTTLITYEYCPSHFCFPPFPAITIDLSIPNGVDAQCKHNRTGNLCGHCDLGLTLSLGSSRCIECSQYWPALLCVIMLSAILAGIVVVVLILTLDLTVAKGTLNAMILYANVMHLGGNQGLFLAFERPNFVSILIAWLNLDIGFDVCFFKDLDMYFKQWLQLIFPMYLILLVIAVIIACNFSSTFAKLIGKRNPVATLATLILLSYARLLNSTIDILSFATLQYTPMDENDSFKETVWLTDASIPYLCGKHIPLFIVAILILLVGLLYTILLTCWQWFIRLPSRTPFKWVRNAKLASFMDAYHAPYVARNRYWTGLLLLARVVLFLIAAINVSGEPRVNYLAVSLVVGSIFLLRTYSGMCIYKKWTLDVFEFTTHFNILALVVTKFYVLQPDSNHNTTITSVSIGFQFAIFLCILTHHIVLETNILKWMKKSKLYKKQFRHDITVSLLDNEPQTHQTNQLVTYSEITIENQSSGLTSKAKGREDVMTLFSN